MSIFVHIKLLVSMWLSNRLALGDQTARRYSDLTAAQKIVEIVNIAITLTSKIGMPMPPPTKLECRLVGRVRRQCHSNHNQANTRITTHRQLCCRVIT